MSVTVKHLNSDASFLLTFQPILPLPPTPGHNSNFTIVIDPWLSGTSNIFHPLFASSKNTDESCISSLTDIDTPDLIIISQSMSDHCHKPTLTRLPRTGGKFLILAEPSAAKSIRSWKHFDDAQVITLKNWSPPSKKSIQSLNIHRITLPALSSQGRDGEVTVTLIKEGDTAGVKNAIAITYRPPTTHLSSSASNKPIITSPLPFTPPASPSSTLLSPSTSIPLSLPSSQRTLSVLHAPHGIPYATLHPFVTSHLISTSALPLTILLHCFDRVQNPKWLGGNICLGADSGVEIAEQLMARAWISNHDGDKVLGGMANRLVKIERWERQRVAERVSPRRGGFRDGEGTEVLVLGVGEERCFSGAGLSFGSKYIPGSIPKEEMVRGKGLWVDNEDTDVESDIQITRDDDLGKVHAFEMRLDAEASMMQKIMTR